MAMDTYNPRTNLLTIPWVFANGNTYSNVILRVDNVLMVNGNFNHPYVDYYDGKYNTLYIGSVNVDGVIYKNVAITPGEIIYVGGSGVAPKGCGTPSFDYVTGIGDFTISTNLWGIRGPHTWDTWKAEDFEMCMEGKAIQNNLSSSASVKFNWRWPLEPYINPLKPITKNFATINYTPEGKPLSPIPLKNTALVFNHDITLNGSGNNQTFYDLYLGTSSKPLEVPFATNFDGAINISFRISSTTGYLGNDEALYHGVQIDGREWIVRTNGRTWVQFMVANNSFLKGSVNINEFMRYIKSINFKENLDNYFIRSIELGNEQIDGIGTLEVKNFFITK